MSDTQGGEARAGRRWSWWSVVLVVSLGLNLLFAGAAASRYFFHPPGERMIGMSYLQLVPRRFFFSDLDKPRRDELLGLLKTYRDRFRAGQENSRNVAESLANALDATPYDEAKVRSVVDAFGKNGSDMIGLGSQAAMELIGRLTPEERASLARRIRERAQYGHRKNVKPPPDAP